MMKYLNEYQRLSLFAFGIPPVYLRPIFLAVHPYFIFSKPLRKDIHYKRSIGRIKNVFEKVKSPRLGGAASTQIRDP